MFSLSPRNPNRFIKPLITFRVYKDPTVIVLVIVFPVALFLILAVDPSWYRIHNFGRGVAGISWLVAFAIYFTLFRFEWVELYASQLVFRNLIRRKEIELAAVSEVSYSRSRPDRRLGDRGRTLVFLYKDRIYANYRSQKIWIDSCPRQDISELLQQIHKYNKSIQFDAICNEMMNGDFSRVQ